jgi:hypothetical protein
MSSISSPQTPPLFPPVPCPVAHYWLQKVFDVLSASWLLVASHSVSLCPDHHCDTLLLPHLSLLPQQNHIQLLSLQLICSASSSIAYRVAAITSATFNTVSGSVGTDLLAQLMLLLLVKLLLLLLLLLLLEPLKLLSCRVHPRELLT